jgi:hypothetical protein
MSKNATFPDSLTREKGSVNQNCKNPHQTIPHNFTQMTYYDKKPLFFRASAPQFQFQFQLLSKYVYTYQLLLTTNPQ